MDGPDASLDEVARRAGVGNATLHRHFPTRRTAVSEVASAVLRLVSEGIPPR